MARPETISEQQILCAARAVFLEKGLSATTAEIARRAGVSEGSIFRRFATKHELLIAALSPEGIFDEIDALLTDPDAQRPEDTLTDAAHVLLDGLAEFLPRKVLLMAHGLDPREIFRQIGEPPPARMLRALAGFFDRQQRAGHLRPADPEITARTFLGALHFFAFAEFSGVNEHLPMPRATFLRGLIDQLFRGVATSPHAASDLE